MAIGHSRDYSPSATDAPSIENDPASAAAGKDLQLEKAVEVLKKEIAEKPFTFPARPAYPMK